MLNKGDEINNYTLEKYLGKGSYGEVWLAKKKIELSDDGILVALKFLAYQPQKGKTEDNFIKQVRREVGTWIRASGHKNIVSVQDGFAFREDTFVIVSDFAEGGSLGDWLQNNGGKSPNLEKTVEIMAEILDGLTHLHSQSPDKIIHRDLKPDNILFKSGVPCITDFGVSRMSQTITKSMAEMAATSAGTPLYMSPESFNQQPASRLMDIWSAGVILYQMLSGAFPYYADNPIALALEVLSANPPKPLPADVPHTFQAVVAKALVRDVSQRFQSAEEMKAALKNAFENRKSAQIQPKTSETIIDEDFDKTADSKVDLTQDWRDIEAEKQREAEEKRKEQEAVEQERKRQLREQEAEKERRRLQDSQPKKSNTWKWLLGGFGGLGLLLFGILIVAIMMIARSGGEISNVGNKPATNSANRPNVVSNKPANTAVTTSNNPDTFKNSIGMEFVKIPSGSFTMGSPTSETYSRDNERPQHRVTIEYEFYLGKYEVTQEEYEKVTGTNPSNFKNCPKCPVESVTWKEANEFIKKLNTKNDGYEYRLPSEAEWEYAARGGKEGQVFGIGDGNNLSSSQANFDGNDPYGNAAKGNYLIKTVNVGSYQPNAFGLYDMHGNVWEWCEDIYKDSYSGLSANGSANMSGKDSDSRVLRGGSWVNYGILVRSAVRNWNSPDNRNYYSGFRVAVRVR